MSDTIITVEGRHEYHHPAERGTVRLGVGFEGPDREAVVAFSTREHAEFARQAEELLAEGSVTRWSADRLRVWSDRPWNQDGKQLPLVHHANIGLEVRFSDLQALAAWVERVAAHAGVTVNGIEWALTEATEARITAEAQHLAVQDAVGRATAYATSLGLTTVRPLAIADPGMLGGEAGDVPSPGGAPIALAMMSRSGGGSGDDDLDLKPEEITVTARVHARFAAS